MPNAGGTMRPEHGDDMGCYRGDDVDTIKEYLDSLEQDTAGWSES
jgi:hypothetical protein